MYTQIKARICNPAYRTSTSQQDVLLLYCTDSLKDADPTEIRAKCSTHICSAAVAAAGAVVAATAAHQPCARLLAPQRIPALRSFIHAAGDVVRAAGAPQAHLNEHNSGYLSLPQEKLKGGVHSV